MSTQEVKKTDSEEDSKVAEKATQLRNILNKIKNNSASKDGNKGLELKGRASSSTDDNPDFKFKAFKPNDSVVGKEICTERFEDGHCKNMLYGQVVFQLPNSIIGGGNN